MVAPMGLGTRLITELTVDLELRECGRGTVNDELINEGCCYDFCTLMQLWLVILDIYNQGLIDPKGGEGM